MHLDNKQPKNFWKDLFLFYYRPIFIVTAVLILFLGYRFFLENKIVEYRNNYQILRGLESRIIQGQDQLEKSKAFSEKLYRPTASDSRIFDMVLADKLDQSSLIEHLSTMANRSGFTVASINFEDINGNSIKRDANYHEYGKVLVRLKLSGGGYEQLKNLIALAESSIMLTEVSSVSFDSKSPLFELSLIVYYYKPIDYGQK